MSMDDQILKRLLLAFRGEAEEHINAISALLVELEETETEASSSALIESAMREMHSLKGAARMVNLNHFESVCQNMETVLSSLKRKEQTLSQSILDALHQGVNVLSSMLASEEWRESEPHKKEVVLVIERLSSLSATARGESDIEPNAVPTAESKTVPVFAVPSTKPAGHTVGEQKSIDGPVPASISKTSHSESLRISAAKLDRLFRQSEEMLSLKLFAFQRLTEINGLINKAELWEKEWSKIRPELRSWHREAEAEAEAGRHSPLKLLEFLEWSHASLKSMQSTLSALRKAAEHDARLISTSTETLLEDAKELLMLPSSTLLEMLPKLTRDLSRAQGKEVELILQGMEIDLDKRILEEIKAPLIHLVRNSIDHGIEKPDIRVQNNKPRKGKIIVSFSRVEDSMVELTISDDGGGIDISEVKQAATRTGFSSEEVERLDEQSALELIFRSSLSTSPIITEISGRGLGMAVVREKVEQLNGRITVESKLGMGTSFHLFLPVALSTFRGLIVQTAGQQFIIPISNVESVIRFRPEEIKTVENRETIVFRSRPAALVELADVLELLQKARASEQESFRMAVIVSAKQKHIAFSVNEVLAVQEVLVKSLQQPLLRVRNVAAAAILGSGKVVPVLNAQDLILSAIETRATRKVSTAEQSAAASYSILVVDDSITARTMIRDILDLAGYNVKTAVDGIDGWTELKSSKFDLVVCDVDMPRMNGFDLTAKIRSDAKLSSLPVILLTALASREDRERGIDVGANAYIVKSSFDQSNLLDVIQKLI